MSGRTIVQLAPEVLAWARDRADVTADELAAKMRVKSEDVLAWERDGRISHSRIRRLAKSTYTPWGSLYRKSPPVETLPLKDFRTLGAETPARLSVNLRETVNVMRSRVRWMREYLIEEGAAPLEFVGSGSVNDSPRALADILCAALSIPADWATDQDSYDGALAALRDLADGAGILLVFNGIVGNDTHRALDRREFQGFAISDPYAPLVFVNNADFKKAQMFTFTHELAHLVIGADVLSRHDLEGVATHELERLCNRVAAEFLVPEVAVRRHWRADADSVTEVRRLAPVFKVSTIVVARRALDARLIDKTVLRNIYATESARWQEEPKKGSGGNFWNNQKWRVGLRFAAAVTSAVRTKQLSYTRAFRLTGLRDKNFFSIKEKLL